MAVVVASHEVAEVTAATSITVNKPAGTAAGDVLVTFFAAETTALLPTPSTWVTIGSEVAGSVSVGMYYKIAGASEPATYTASGLPSGRHTWHLLRLTGVDQANVLDAPGSSATTGSIGHAQLDMPSVTIRTPIALMVTGLGCQSTGLDRTWELPPDSVQVSTSTGIGRRSITADDVMESAGATGVRSFILSAHLPQAGIQAAFRPATVAVSINASGTLTAQVTQGSTAAAALTSTATLTAALGSISQNAAALLDTEATLTATTETNAQTVTANLTASGALSSQTAGGANVPAALTASGRLSATTSTAAAITAPLTATATLTARLPVWRDITVRATPLRERTILATYRE